MDPKQRKLTTIDTLLLCVLPLGFVVSGYYLQHSISLVLSVLYRDEYTLSTFRITDFEVVEYRRSSTTYAKGLIGEDPIERCAIWFCDIDRRDVASITSELAKRPYEIEVLYAPAWRLNEGGLNGGNFSIIPRDYATSTWASVAMDLAITNSILLIGIGLMVRHVRIYGWRRRYTG